METTTDLTLFDLNETEIVKKLAVTKEELLALVKQSKHYTITGIDDKQGLSQVHEHRILLRDKRIEIEKGAKALRDNATRFSRTVSAREKEFISIISPEEERLKSKELWIEGEKEKIRVEEERKRAEALQAKIDALHAVNASHDLNELMVIPDEVFAELLEQHTIAYNHKKAREEEERLFKEAEAKKEKDRLATIEKAEEERRQQVAREQAAERIRLEEIRRAQDVKDKELEWELNRIRQEQENFEKKKAEFEAKQKALVEQQRRNVELEEAKKKAAQEALKEAEIKAQLEKDRIAQELELAPDKAKLANLADRIYGLIKEAPEVKTQASKQVLLQAIQQLKEVAASLMQKSKKDHNNLEEAHK